MTKRIPLLLLALLVVAALAWWGLRHILGRRDLSRELRDQLTALVTEKSNRRYRLNIGDIRIDVDSRSVLLKDIRLRTMPGVLAVSRDGVAAPRMEVDLELDNLLIKDIDVLHFLETNRASLGTITASGGRLALQQVRPADSVNAPTRGQQQELVKKMRRQLRSIHIDSIQLNDIDLTYHNRKQQPKTVQKIHIALQGVDIDSSAALDSSRLFFSKSITVSLQRLSLPVAGGDYRLGAKELVLQVSDSSIGTIRGIRLEPAGGGSVEAVARKSGVQDDVYQLRADELIVYNLDYGVWLEDSLVKGDLVMIKDLEVEVYKDRSQRPTGRSKLGKYPHQLLRRLPWSLQVADLVIDGGRVRYRERNAEGDAVGSLRFDAIKGRIGGLSKKGDEVAPFRVGFQGRFQAAAALEGQIHFDDPSTGAFRVQAALGAFNAAVLNEVTVPLGMAKLTEGRIQSLRFTIRGNDRRADGTTYMAYENLKVELLRKDAEGDLKKKGLLTTLANAFVLRTHNTTGDRHPNSTRVSYRRDPSKSFFNLVWKTVFYGVKGTTGVGEVGLDKDRATIHK